MVNNMQTTRNRLYFNRLSTLPNPTLIGADDRCQKLTKTILQTDSFIRVVGLGGVGKTALVQKTVHQDVLGEAFHDLIWLHGGDDVSKLPNLREKPTLVVVDDVDTTAATVLIPQLQTSINPSKVIFISRQQVQGISSFVVPELSEEDAIALLAYHLKRRNFTFTLTQDRPILEHIYDQVGGHPLAIHAIVEHNYMFPLEHVLRDLAQNATFAKRLYTDVYAGLSEVLSDDAKSLLVAFAFGGPSVSRAYLQDVAEINAKDRFDQAIQELVDHCLIQRSGPDKQRVYHIHRLTLTYVRASWNSNR